MCSTPDKNENVEAKSPNIELANVSNESLATLIEAENKNVLKQLDVVKLLLTDDFKKKLNKNSEHFEKILEKLSENSEKFENKLEENFNENAKKFEQIQKNLENLNKNVEKFEKHVNDKQKEVVGKPENLEENFKNSEKFKKNCCVFVLNILCVSLTAKAADYFYQNNVY